MKPLRVVVDCNVFISILIGGSMKPLRDFLFSEGVKLIFSEDLLSEIVHVGARSHSRKYFDEEKLNGVIALIREIGELVEDPKAPPKRSRDPDDDYLIAVARASNTHVLITGDKDLLVLEKIGRTRIMKPKEFTKEFL